MDTKVRPSSFPATARERGKIAPVKFAHIVLNTPRYREMIEWYKNVLEAVPVFENEMLAFITYDDEHHRVAFLNSPDLKDKPPGTAGAHHLAFTYASLGDLLATYKRLKKIGILPAWSINHGPTTSMYYKDPDGSALELQVDNFDSLSDASDYMVSEDFASNPIGVEFDPEALIARVETGVPLDELRRRPPGAMSPIRI